ncbi:DUF2062 domain-containing protein [Mesorhizobium sp. NPDC059054]|uniref:DUF2062 domain-containing protein n=1 Tax=Mesorhizobium sp. NPDC059054 TaxID=3346711 RepID=UPI003688E0AD
MLFKRRKAESFGERLRVWLWPRRSLSRSLRYYAKRVVRLKATPHAVAAGVAAGVFASFFPLGLHFVVAAAVCWLVAGNLVAAAIGTALGNPLTMPFLWGASWETGKLILHEHLPHKRVPQHLGAMMEHLSLSQLWEPVLKPMTIGAVPLGLLTGCVAYGLTRWGMTAFRERRRRRLAERAARRQISGSDALGSATR